MRLNFLNPETKIGMNSTVRLGERTEFQPGTELEIYQTEGDTILARGIVTETKVKPYWKVTHYDIRFQHDEKTKNLPGLWEAMVSAYGEKITRDSLVTVVYFRIH
jgi:hypothetical protein